MTSSSVEATTPWPRPEIPKLPGTGPTVLLPSRDGEMLPSVLPGREEVRIYVCGITPYDATHLGHAATYLLFDVLIRALLDSGLRVKFVENVTDVDDPLFDRAKATQADWQEIARDQTALFITDMTALRVIPPDSFVLTSEQMSQISDLVNRLVQQGVTYELDGRIYLDLGQLELLPMNQDLAMTDLIELLAERGGDPEKKGKRNPLDPIIWVKTQTDPNWPAPFGSGRPGWHVECVSIMESFLGFPVDIQGGGSDLEFPHHQMCASTVNRLSGVDLARHYVHSGLVYLGDEKMSKSRGNLVFVSKLLESGANPMCIRLALIDRDWQSSLHWSEESLVRAQKRLERWTLAACGDSDSPQTEAGNSDYALAALREIRGSLANGLNMVSAIQIADTWAGSLISEPESLSITADKGLFRRVVDSLLGVKLGE